MYPIYTSHGHQRKTHLGNGGGTLCGAENRHPHLLYCCGEDYRDVLGDFINIDASGVGCEACKKKALRILAAEAADTK